MRLFLAMFTMLFFLACDKPTPTSDTHTETTDSEIPESKTVSDESGFAWQTETFADLGILRYQVPDFEKLTLKQKEYVYYLTQAGLAGRDIIYDQNYRHNLTIRRALEKMIENYKGDKSSRDYYDLETYAKRIWFSIFNRHLNLSVYIRIQKTMQTIITERTFKLFSHHKVFSLKRP